MSRYLFADAIVRLASTTLSGTEGDSVDVCVEAGLSTPVGTFETNLVVQLSATPGTAGDLSDRGLIVNVDLLYMLSCQ